MERFLRGIYVLALSLVMLSVTFSGVFAEESSGTPGIEAVVENAASATDSMNLVYQSNVENIGWQEAVSANEVSGTATQDQAIDAFAISIPSSMGSVKVRSSVENEGWDDWTGDAGYATGAAQGGDAIEAVQMELTGAASEQYDLYYSVKVQGLGWMDWAKNGETAGTTNLNRAVEGIQVTYTEKDAPAPGVAECASIDGSQLRALGTINYTAHVSEEGWQPTVSDGQTAGTTGEHLSIEAMTMSLPHGGEIGGNSQVAYSLQCENVGWMPEVTDNQTTGTIGQGLNAEAATVKLTGRAAELYDVYYRVHASVYGWLDWAKNGEVAGTTGIATAAEAIQVELVPKGDPAPGETTRTSITPEYLQSRANVVYNAYVQDNGWQNENSNSADAGTIGESKQIEAITVNIPNRTPDSQVIYQAHVSDYGWMEPVSNGNIAGTTGEGRAVQAFTISLLGEDSYSYDIYYQAYVQNYGWLGWAKNGEYAGTTGAGLRLEAFHVLMLPRGSVEPGPTENAYLNLEKQPEGWMWPLDGITNISSPFGMRNGSQHLGIDIPASQGTPIRAVKSGTVTLASWYFGYGNCVIVTNDSTGEDVYYGHMSGYNTNAGAHVNQGDVVGFVGNTGNSYGSHLHLGIKDHGVWLNPLDLY